MQTDEKTGTSARRSLEELTTPRPWGMPSPDIFDGALLNIEDQLRSSVPAELRKRIGVTRNLAVYGAFCYDFITVAAFWSFTCVEMALWMKFLELHPGPIIIQRKGQTESISFPQLPGNLRLRWRIVGKPEFNGSFQSLVDWATTEKLVQNDSGLGTIVRFRNSFAHPTDLNTVWSPPMAVQIFEMMIEVVNQLWPLELSPDRTMPRPTT
jgi:hypothetical protein